MTDAAQGLAAGVVPVDEVTFELRGREVMSRSNMVGGEERGIRGYEEGRPEAPIFEHTREKYHQLSVHHDAIRRDAGGSVEDVGGRGCQLKFLPLL